ncbi:acetyl-CoA carboxylase biotin carboxylase subunit [Rhizobium sp. AG207R]|uniref:acetyl-CoA carboxylase biotin carboxylase subunit n=1 Tax=Rhizobium sp. AG207R TaxID=2802287 RepID=UPI0022ABFFB4|nr:acetyl/propionyl/methylcrotonyl-CoA carboxylase subunit alpha [Rhizobium sp. AG207R]MCZ3378419.1 acetyl/propionyl/methylcrotonyl-CoA carboxylase subunit alpha [Rhizobium sp. AG207R]
MFKKILIANRGEIACRIIRTAKRMNIATVAVYSDADRNAIHVRMADEAVHIGPSEASKSYLAIERIVAACKSTGAEAVHPGYGFLSEQVAFAEALLREGIVFIGPNPRAIRAMGDKILSKKAASAAGVSTVPGYPDAIETADHAVEIAESIGYPVMIKASAGGGGKGMRIAYNEDEAREGFNRARSEAASSFGDDRVFVEKFIREPRHIEIQVLGDKHGNVIHLGERECSVQRRNQKVLEEAPSPLLDEETRQIMGAQAVALAKAVGYDSAGTVEFVVGQDKSFYFLEMNTRLQVEHPVTEFVTGLDLVEKMIRIAAGQRLQLKQKDVRLQGWAVEARVYAEDPAQGFVPSTGRLSLFRPPVSAYADATVRVDVGVEEGSSVTVYYDPMIAKLITHASTRDAAMEAQIMALDSFAIDGIQTNLSFLSSLMTLPRWLDGHLSTSLISEEYGATAKPKMPEGDHRKLMAAICASVHHRLEQVRENVDGFGTDTERRYVLILDNADADQEVKISVAVRGEGDGNLIIFAEGEQFDLSTAWLPSEPTFVGVINDIDLACQVRISAEAIAVYHRGRCLMARVLSPFAAEMLALMPHHGKNESEGLVLAPMPGVVREIGVAVGDTVGAGQAVAIVEAMKMEVTIRAQISGRVCKIFCKSGANVSANSPLISIEM